MNTLRESAYQDTFSRNVVVSLALHIAVVLTFVIRAVWLPSEPLIIRSAIRVDMVALPDKAPPAAPTASESKSEPTPVVKGQPAKAKPKPVPEAKAPARPTIDPKAAQRKALEKLKALQAIERIKGEVNEREANSKPKVSQFKGNVLTAGDGLSGLAQIEFDRYFGAIESKIRSNWSLPGWLDKAKLRAQALVLIDSSGLVIKRQIITSSGNEVFDNQALDAIDKSQPFPEPPARLKDVLALKGIVFNFPD